MNDGTREWIEKLKAEDKAGQQVIDEIEQTEDQAERAIAAGAPGFWREFLKDVELSVEALGELDLEGSSSEIEPNGCHIEVGRSGAQPKHTWTNVFFSDNPAHVRFLELNQPKAHDLVFQLRTGVLVVTSQDPPYPSMNAEQAAHYIVERMVRWVRR